MRRLGHLVARNHPSRPAVWSELLWLLVMLLVADLAFIELHRLYLQGALDVRFSLEIDGSLPDQYQHAKELLTAFATAWLLFVRADLVYASWTGLFGYMWADDRFELHEHFGVWFTNMWPTALAGIPAQSIGEMTITGIAFGGFLVALTHSWLRSTDVARNLSVWLMAALIGLALPGVVVDAVHAMVRVDPWRYRLGIVEEGGELLMVSVLTWIVVAEAVSEVRVARGARRPVAR